MNSVAILCPIVDWINHSFEHNCRLEGNYYQHESESFVIVRAVKDIQLNEELTVNYGNLPNHDFLMKFGFLNQNNIYNEMCINLDFSECLEYTSQLFSLKQKVFKSISGFQLEKMVIFENKMNVDLLSYLRVYFLSYEDVDKNPNINNFIIKDF